jgi:hypothetical protein
VLAAHQRRETAGNRDVEALLHLGDTYDLVELERRGHAFERLVPKRLAGEIALDEPLRRRADNDGIRRCQPLNPRRNIWCVAQGQLLLPPASTYLPHHDEPGMDPDADRQADIPPLSQAAIEGGQCLYNA